MSAWSQPPARFDFSAPALPAAELRAVHLIAIGGAGMSGVARMYLSQTDPHPIAVSGSDRTDSSTLQELAAQGAQVRVGHDPAHLAQVLASHARHPGSAAVIISGAIPEDNPELIAARAAGLPVLHRAQAIAGLVQGRTVIAVAGANGKTTTSALTTAALIAAGAQPGYVLGSPLTFTTPPANAAPGGATAPVVIEADESDGSFLTYRPDVAIVTNVQPDHLDFYGDFEAVQQAYARFVDTIRPGGLLVTSADDPGASRLADYARTLGQRVLTWGRGTEADVQLSALHTHRLRASATVRIAADLGPGTPPVGTELALSVPMPGEHNVHNAVAALLATQVGLGMPVQPLIEGLAAFGGVHRRFERIGEAGGVELVDDYAHNAPKVAAAVAAARSAADGRRVVIAFQPHLYSRTRDFARGFADALAGADLVVLLPIFGARESAQDFPGVDSSLIADNIAHLQGQAEPRGPLPQVHVLADRNQAIPTLLQLLRAGDLLLTVGAGDITGIGPELLQRLGHDRREPEVQER